MVSEHRARPIPVSSGRFRLTNSLARNGGVFAGAFSENQKIGERISAETIRAIDSRGAFTGGEQSRHARHLRVGIDVDPAHDVVRGRPDFHRLLRDVDIAELL